MAKFEITVSDEAKEIAAKYAEMHSERRGEKVTIAEMLGEFAETGAFRRVAATKWSRKNAKPAAPKAKKAPKAKATKKAAPKGPLARKVASKAKAPRVRKANRPKLPAAAQNVPEGEVRAPAATQATAEPVLD